MKNLRGDVEITSLENEIKVKRYGLREKKWRKDSGLIDTEKYLFESLLENT